MKITTTAENFVDGIASKDATISGIAFEEVHRAERFVYPGQQASEVKAQLLLAFVSKAARFKGEIPVARKQQSMFFCREPAVKLAGLGMKHPSSVIEELAAEASEV